MNQEDFVSYSQAVRLKKLGFGWECKHLYGKGNYQMLENCSHANFNAISVFNLHESNSQYIEVYSAPSLSQAQKWLREVKEWDVTAIPTLGELGKKMYRWDICHWNNPEYGEDSGGIFNDYESALSAGLDAVLKLLEEKI